MNRLIPKALATGVKSIPYLGRQKTWFFLVMERFGEDLYSVTCRDPPVMGKNKVLNIGIQLIDCI